MPNAWVTIPNTFAGQSGNVPASQLDTNFTNLNTGTPSTFQGSSRLTFVSTTQIQLGLGVIPLQVSGNWILRPVTTVLTISNATLAASTTYFVYVFDSAGVATLELSTTAHVTNTVFGIEQKSGDATRTLVGMIRTTAGILFADSAQQRFTASFFSRRQRALLNTLSAGAATASLIYVEIDSTHRIEFVSWSDEDADAFWGGASSNGTASAANYHNLGLTGVVALAPDVINQNPTATNQSAFQVRHVQSVAEGYNYYTALMKVSAGTATMNQAQIGGMLRQ